MATKTLDKPRKTPAKKKIAEKTTVKKVAKKAETPVKAAKKQATKKPATKKKKATEKADWYDYPQYFDLGFRDETAKEVAFLPLAFERLEPAK